MWKLRIISDEENVMKKGLIIASVAFLLLTTALYIGESCLKNDPITCPDETKVTSMVLSKVDGEEKEIAEEDYTLFLTCIRNAVPTIKDSVNDTPYEKEYYTLTISTEWEQYRYYVYQKGSQYYIEKPYEGIYKAHEVIGVNLLRQF